MRSWFSYVLLNTADKPGTRTMASICAKASPSSIRAMTVVCDRALSQLFAECPPTKFGGARRARVATTTGAMLRRRTARIASSALHHVRNENAVRAAIERIQMLAAPASGTRINTDLPSAREIATQLSSSERPNGACSASKTRTSSAVRLTDLAHDR
jgi:hypothetical protein